MPASHYLLYLSLTVVAITLAVLVIVMVLMWYFRKSGSRYRSLHNQHGGSVQYQPQNESLRYPDPDTEKGAVPYHDIGDVTRDDSDPMDITFTKAL